MSKKYLSKKKHVTSEGGVFHNVVDVYHQQLSIAAYQVIVYADNYFEYLPIEFSAFKWWLHDFRGQQDSEISNYSIKKQQNNAKFCQISFSEFCFIW